MINASITLEVQISIHVPLAGNVVVRVYEDAGISAFLSTFPLRGTSAGQ